MGFDTIVGDDPRFPPDLLPSDRRYRPDLGDPGKGGVIVVPVLCGIVAYFLFKYWIPIPTTFETVCFIGALILVFFGVLVMRATKAGGSVNSVLAALPMVGDGRLTPAERLLDDACLQARPNTMVHCYTVYERAQAAMLRGDIAHTLGMAGAIYTSRALKRPGHALYLYWGFSIGLIARCLALQGKTADAEKWQTLARANIADSWSAVLLGTDLILGIRMGRTATVLADAEREWPALESVLRGFELRALRLFCAFGAAQMALEAERPQAAERWLAGLHPKRPGEFAYLCKHWPELQHFITEHGL